MQVLSALSKQSTLLTGASTSALLVSRLWEPLMARKHVCQLEDKLKQDVAAPCSFEGVPHHTSDSAEGRRTTIKGHCVYLNLPASVCQMFQRLSFISSREPCFIFTLLFFLSLLHILKRGKVGFHLLEGGTTETKHAFICFGKSG